MKRSVCDPQIFVCIRNGNSALYEKEKKNAFRITLNRKRMAMEMAQERQREKESTTIKTLKKSNMRNGEKK